MLSVLTEDFVVERLDGVSEKVESREGSQLCQTLGDTAEAVAAKIETSELFENEINTSVPSLWLQC